MSSDNFWYVKGKVFMGDASHYQSLWEQAEAVFDAGYRQRLASRRPYHEAESPHGQ